jgi:hypothetical protein
MRDKRLLSAMVERIGIGFYITIGTLTSGAYIEAIRDGALLRGSCQNQVQIGPSPFNTPLERGK